jgi:hypothetical protein
MFYGVAHRLVIAVVASIGEERLCFAGEFGKFFDCLFNFRNLFSFVFRFAFRVSRFACLVVFFELSGHLSCFLGFLRRNWSIIRH